TVPATRREVNVSIAVPSFATMRTRACGTANVPDAKGIMYGAIRNPDGQQGVYGARVAIS
ncbi:MAG: hypothetical protein ABI120_12640, partial [Gemmatimonadaceae bacterium]